MRDYPPESNYRERGSLKEPLDPKEYIDEEEFKQVKKYETETINREADLREPKN